LGKSFIKRGNFFRAGFHKLPPLVLCACDENIAVVVVLLVLRQALGKQGVKVLVGCRWSVILAPLFKEQAIVIQQSERLLFLFVILYLLGYSRLNILVFTAPYDVKILR
jgi:hypothetical protein